MINDDKATIAENAIFRGRFDHWGAPDDGRFECGVGDCTTRERGHEDPTRAFRRHLATEHMGDVIEAIGQRP